MKNLNLVVDDEAVVSWVSSFDEGGFFFFPFLIRFIHDRG